MPQDVNRRSTREALPKSQRVVLLGDVSVGKSALVTRYTRGEFVQHYNTTIGTAFHAKTLRATEIGTTRDVRLEIWDTAGQERFHAIAPLYYRKAQAAIVVYDLHAPSTFDAAVKWIDTVRHESEKPSDLIIALVGNKADISGYDELFDRGRQYAADNGLVFMETSAKTDFNVSLLFGKIAQALSLKPVRSERRTPSQVFLTKLPYHFHVWFQWTIAAIFGYHAGICAFCAGRNTERCSFVSWKQRQQMLQWLMRPSSDLPFPLHLIFHSLLEYCQPFLRCPSIPHKS